MRIRLLTVAASVALTTAMTPTATAAVDQNVRIDGVLGPVSIGYDRLADLIDKGLALPSVDAAESFLASLSSDEQRAVHYAMNPAFTTRVDAPPCPTAPDCDPPKPVRQPQAEVKPPPAGIVPPPSPPPVECDMADPQVEVHTLIGDKVVVKFIQHAYWCWDGFVVSEASIHATYTVTGPFWRCLGESDGYPKNILVPGMSGPTVKAISSGVCVYALNMTLPYVGNVQIDAGRHQMEIDTTFHHNGARISTMV